MCGQFLIVKFQFFRFSPSITRDLLFEFDGLDTTRQGILEYEDLLRYNDSSLTPAFVRRLFLVLHNEGKPSGLAYDDFTEFAIAYRNPKVRSKALLLVKY